MNVPQISTLFLDIGGVLLTNGWDRTARQQAAEHFQLDHADLEERHHLTYDTYEAGKLSLAEYLRRVVFYQQRPFSMDTFKEFMLSRSQSFPETIQLIQAIKKKYRIMTVAVNNEGREINDYRIRTFQLNETIDTFVSSCYVHYRKPDLDIYRIALDIAQAQPEAVAYIDDRALFIEVAGSLGIHGILHTDVATTRGRLAELGLKI
ncbi:MAG: hydrolase [Anaerolineales bacterium]|nr:HAD family phosphatase [Anaerolineae bacterium]PWB54656.1 MAG: hydrolase [Anaerolineales bacterium]